MGYRCDKCRKPVKPGTDCNLVAVATRTRHYPFRKAVNRPIKYVENGKPKVRFPDDPGGVGREVVTELKLCPACAGKSTPPAK